MVKVIPDLIEKKIYRKKKIPIALREQVWLHHFGKKYENKCYVKWCLNKITIINFQCGHDIPESKGGQTTLTNLYPICCRCNSSMGDRYTLKEWSACHRTPILSWNRYFCCF